MRALLLLAALLLLVLNGVPVLAAKPATGNTATTAAWWARIVSVPRADGRYQVSVDGRGGGGRWSWAGSATVSGNAVQWSGSGSATVRVVVEAGRIAVEAEGVEGVRIDWTGEIK